MNNIAEIVELEVDQFHPDELNPNSMSDDKFNMLCDKIREEKFTDPIKVAPIKESDYKPEWRVGVKHYRIWGGEHRWRGAKVIGMDKVPAIIYDEFEDDYERRLRLVRDNMVKGEADPKKFTALLKSLDPDMDINPRLLGFEDEQEMMKFVIKEADTREKNFLDGLLEEANKQKIAVDSISDIVATIFSECAETVDQDYLMFTYKGALICVVLANKDTFVEVQKMIDHLQKTAGNINTFIAEAIRLGLVKSVQSIGQKSGEKSEKAA